MPRSWNVVVPILLVGANDSLVALWQTEAGGNGTVATAGTGVGNYDTGEGPDNAFDNNFSSKFTHFGSCTANPSTSAPSCGLQTGFTLTLQRGATVMKALQFRTGIDLPPRDPLTITLEGSNQNGSTLLLGSSWTLVYNGSSGLDVDPGRASLGVTQTFASNTIAYSSYRLLTTLKRGSEIAAQYGELQLFAF